MKLRDSTWRSLVLLVLAGQLCAACGRRASAQLPSVPADSEALSSYTLTVVKTWPHDRSAFTQGLLFWNGSLLESTGLYGQSSLREVDLPSGRILKTINVPSQFFAEGLTVLNGKAYQLTWQNHRGFIYDAATFQSLGEFNYEGEGWGLTNDGTSLVLSDGSSRIRFLDPRTFAVTRVIDVTENGKPVVRLNELEWVNGEIFANVWQTDRIVRIDPNTGRVRGIVDCAGLLSPMDRVPGTDVLNGIAYDPASDRLIITGKRWPKLFEVKLQRRNN